MTADEFSAWALKEGALRIALVLGFFGFFGFLLIYQLVGPSAAHVQPILRSQAKHLSQPLHFALARTLPSSDPIGRSHDADIAAAPSNDSFSACVRKITYKYKNAGRGKPKKLGKKKAARVEMKKKQKSRFAE